MGDYDRTSVLVKSREGPASVTIVPLEGTSMSLVRLLLILTAVGAFYLVFFAPARLRRIGFYGRRVGLAYVAAILISALLRHFLDWGT